MAVHLCSCSCLHLVVELTRAGLAEVFAAARREVLAAARREESEESGATTPADGEQTVRSKEPGISECYTVAGWVDTFEFEFEVEVETVAVVVVVVVAVGRLVAVPGAQKGSQTVAVLTKAAV